MKKYLIMTGTGFGILIAVIWARTRYAIGPGAEFGLFLLAYLLLGVSVFRRLIQNIENRQYFNENILIVLATAGALGVGRYVEGCAVLLLFAVSGIVEEMAVGRSRRALEGYLDIRPEKATRRVRGKEVEVDPSELKVQHIIIVKPGERVPVDGIVISGATALDTQALTGESMPREVGVGDKIFSGCINLSGVVEVRVTRTYEDSTVSRILQMVEQAGREDLVRDTPVARFLWKYTPFVTVLAFAIALVPPMSFAWGRWHEWIYRGLVFLVAACPCGLLVSEPLAFLGGIVAAAKHGIIVKGGHFLERLARADIFVFDKTGTLTKGVFQVTQVCPTGMTKEELLRYVAHAESFSSHPIANSILEAYGKEIDKKLVRSVKEVPGCGVSATVEGHRVHVGNVRMMQRQWVKCKNVQSGGTVLHVILDRTYAGYLIVNDVVKEEARDTMRWLRENASAVLVMLTGDRKEAAQEVADELELDYAYAGLLPGDKIDRLDDFIDLEGRSEMVVFVGDGINDALVLTEADVGIAMGAFGTDAAVEAADVILMEDDLYGIVDLIHLARETVTVVQSNLTLAMVVKLVVLVLAVAGLIPLWSALVSDLVVMFAALLNAMSIVYYPIDVRRSSRRREDTREQSRESASIEETELSVSAEKTEIEPEKAADAEAEEPAEGAEEADPVGQFLARIKESVAKKAAALQAALKNLAVEKPVSEDAAVEESASEDAVDESEAAEPEKLAVVERPALENAEEEEISAAPGDAAEEKAAAEAEEPVATEETNPIGKLLSRIKQFAAEKAAAEQSPAEEPTPEEELASEIEEPASEEALVSEIEEPVAEEESMPAEELAQETEESALEEDLNPETEEPMPEEELALEIEESALEEDLTLEIEEPEPEEELVLETEELESEETSEEEAAAESEEPTAADMLSSIGNFLSGIMQFAAEHMASEEELTPEIEESTPEEESPWEIVEPTSEEESPWEVVEPTPEEESPWEIVESTSEEESPWEIVESTPEEESPWEIVEPQPEEEPLWEVVEPQPEEEPSWEDEISAPAQPADEWELILTAEDAEPLEDLGEELALTWEDAEELEPEIVVPRKPRKKKPAKRRARPEEPAEPGEPEAGGTREAPPDSDWVSEERKQTPKPRRKRVKTGDRRADGEEKEQ